MKPRLAIFAAALLGTVSCQADLIYYLDDDGPFLGPNQVTSSSWNAQTFSTGAQAMTLNSIAVKIRNESGSPASINLNLYAVDGFNKPTGSSLLSLASNYSLSAWYNNGGLGDNTTFATTFSLAANTTYAVVMSAPSGAPGWKSNDDGVPIASSIVPTPTFYSWRSTDSGSSWSTVSFSSPNTTGFNMIVSASPSAPVPEPGTWAAAALLVGTAGFIRWRKRRNVALEMKD